MKLNAKRSSLVFVKPKDKVKNLELEIEGTKMDISKACKTKKFDTEAKELLIFRKKQILLKLNKALYRYKLKQQENLFKIYDKKYGFKGKLISIFSEIVEIHGICDLNRFKLNSLILKEVIKLGDKGVPAPKAISVINSTIKYYKSK